MVMLVMILVMLVATTLGGMKRGRIWVWRLPCNREMKRRDQQQQQQQMEQMELLLLLLVVVALLGLQKTSPCCYCAT
jgi:hypothetical protein